MNQAIQKLLRDYLRLIFIFSLPWYFEFLPGVELDDGGSNEALLLK